MSRVRVVKTANKEDLSSFKVLGQMFEKIAGVHNRAEPDIVGPKLSEAYNMIVGWLNTLKILVDSKIIHMVAIYANEIPNITGFIEFATDELKLDLSHKYTSSDVFDELAFYQAQLSEDAATIEKIESDLFDKYKALKDSKTVMNIISTCKQLLPYGSSLFAASQMDRTRISKYSRYHPDNLEEPLPKGDIRFMNELGSLKPLCFAPMIDFKFIWVDGRMDKTRRKFLLDFLFNIYYRGITLFDILTSPDVDTGKLSQLFMDAIQAMKKKLNGYDRAFELIEKAADMLTRKFNTYYRESQRNGGNSAVFFESFIIDVAASQSEDLIASAQLKRLADKMKELTMQSPDYQNNEVVQKLVNILSTAVNTI